MTPTILMTPIKPAPAGGGANPGAGGSGAATPPPPRGAFRVAFQGFTPGQAVEVAFVEIDRSAKADDHGKATVLGTVKGTLAVLQDLPNGPVLTLTPASNTAEATDGERVRFSFPAPGAEDKEGKAVTFALPNDPAKNLGEYWEVTARIAEPAAESASFNVARVDRALATRGPKRRATYDWHAGNTVTFYNDASEDERGDKGAFADIREAIEEAKHFIFIADWSFQPYARLRHVPPDPDDKLMKNAPTLQYTIGATLVNKAWTDEHFLVAIHTWDHTNVAAADPHNDDGDDILADIANQIATIKTGRPQNLLWRASSRTGENGGAGLGWSHHQKFIVMDCPGPDGRLHLKAFYGGLDLTKGRFDWHEHRLFPAGSGDEFLRQVEGAKFGTFGGRDKQKYDDWYSGEFGPADPLGDPSLPREPWHDIHAQVVGPAAWDIAREFVGRWNRDPTLTPTQGDNGKKHIQRVNAKFQSLFAKDGDKHRFVLPFEDHGGIWAAQVYRSMVKEHWGSDADIKSPMAPQGEFKWTLQSDVERSIQDAYLTAIAGAERFLYIETQFLIGSGSKWGRSSVRNTVPETIVARIEERIGAKKPFHVYVVMPMFPEGVPDSGGNLAQRFLEWNTVEYMVRAVQEACERGGMAGEARAWEKYLSFYFLANWENVATGPIPAGKRPARIKQARRYMLYVHSKMMIVDDRYVILGSANLNERSLSGGRDSEICVGVWPASSRVAAECEAAVKAFRKRLWSEHFGSQMASLVPGWETPETAAAHAAAAGHANYVRMRECRRDGSGDDAHICCWPLTLDAGKLVFSDALYNGADYAHIPDADFTDDDFLWRPKGAGMIGWFDLAE